MGEKTEHITGVYMNGQYFGTPYYANIESLTMDSEESPDKDNLKRFVARSGTMTIHFTMGNKEREKLIRIFIPNNWRKMHGYPKRRKGWSR